MIKRRMTARGCAEIMTALTNLSTLLICGTVTAAGLSVIAGLLWVCAWIALGVVRTWEMMT